MQIIDGSVTVSKGFSANGVACGIKKRKKDMALVVSQVPCSFAGSFTTNLVKAAPVLWDQKLVASQDHVKAIVINSGNANACTAEQGLKDTEATAAHAGSVLGCKAEEVLVCSTGVIGVPLPMDKVKEGIELCSKELSSSRESSAEAALAICTTDTFKKEVAVSVQIEGKTVHIGGMAKGSGMIHPNMATMLSFITTDAAIGKQTLQALLGSSIIDTYNMISVDGDTSTNDTVLVLANGMSGTTMLGPDHPEWETFTEAFLYVHTELAKAIVRDGEGAGKFLEVKVTGAKDKQTAQTLARSVITSNLVKTAFFCSYANWGRILCAMGYSGAAFNPSSLNLSFSSAKGTIQVVENGVPLAFDEHLAKGILMERESITLAQLKDGSGEGTAWGCDLSYEYVRINGDYRS
ncbi:MAG: bifunctional glutamate N-acetyltransferase/amino-acid acetyltransferase ArgJ [Sphaerochaeta associata]|uniref:bifunctional glutamate N-acetyltransferase/amino-acid acetyltransferase ArgJ n=1 Tax=Sphaerochaeta associata TaxID=1129264 RepID=UPI002B203B23|nr:bifunctional glutamate N-acetyltransferase/amino-acid acetyltransferase ArgJ [Sphaerochaeta associata]MEA5029024.1 bifunctional glutamate N-acetyltransferase/amino-acid acetyltransferase ArgJ [Sphaerochaeta associata]